MTGNPRIVFGEWHIAHMLWGGLAMLGAILIYMVYDNERSQRTATVLSGVGWGLFIDEIGKFLTKDNDYWFRPAIIFIYVSFVLLFLLYRRLARGEEDGGMNLKIIRQTAKVFHLTYNRIFRKKTILVLLSIYSVFFIVDRIWDAGRILSSPEKVLVIRNFYRNYDLFSRTDTYMIGFKLGFDLLMALMGVGGWYWIVNKKIIRGLTFFRYGLLINILLGSVFKFYFEQFSGVFGLILTITTYTLITELQRERLLDNKETISGRKEGGRNKLTPTIIENDFHSKPG